MSIHSRLCAAFFVAALALAVGVPARVNGQAEVKDTETKNAAVENVAFSTVDGVTIRGKFYRGPKAAPVVMLLHNVGGTETSNHPNWVALAKELQTDFSVLAFDFRGHGASTTVDPALYYRNRPNTSAVKGLGAGKETLDIKSHNKLQYPLLCNDIAAAKSYLERTKNDLGECNTQNMFLVGAGEGATLGEIWASSEFYRYRADLRPPTFQPVFTGTPEGKNLSGFMWLSLSPKLGDRTVNVAGLAMLPARSNVSQFCLFAEGDTKSRDVAKGVEKMIHSLKKKQEVLVEIPKQTSVGVELLTPSLKIGPEIHKQLKTLAANVTDREWEKRDFVKTLSAWRFPGSQPVHARIFPQQGGGIPGIGIVAPPPNPANAVPEVIEKNILFNDYERFLR